MRPRRVAYVALAVVLFVYAFGADGAADPPCPLCGMTAGATHYMFDGGQAVQFCGMGHEEQGDPHAWLLEVTDVPPLDVYGSGPFHCPVCNMAVDPHDQGVFRVAVRNNLGDDITNGQSIYACSQSHADDILARPTDYADNGEDEEEEEEEEHEMPFCMGGGTVMLNGFSFNTHGACVIFLFPGWVINTPTKLAFAVIGTLCMGIAVEALLALRRNTLSGRKKGYYTMDNNPTAKARLLASVFFALITTLGYFLMLIAMTYHAGLFIAIIVGLVAGQAVFRRTEPVSPHESLDPCCNA